MPSFRGLFGTRAREPIPSWRRRQSRRGHPPRTRRGPGTAKAHASLPPVSEPTHPSLHPCESTTIPSALSVSDAGIAEWSRMQAQWAAQIPQARCAWAPGEFQTRRSDSRLRLQTTHAPSRSKTGRGPVRLRSPSIVGNAIPEPAPFPLRRPDAWTHRTRNSETEIPPCRAQARPASLLRRRRASKSTFGIRSGNRGGFAIALAPYQMLTLSEGSSHRASPSATAKASAKASTFFTTPLQRNSAGECGSVAMRVRMYSVRRFSCQMRA